MKENKNILKSKISVIIILLIIVLILLVGIKFCLKNFENKNIPNDYIAVFNGGSGEITYSTYIYKIDNGQANYGFKYINVQKTTKSWGSPDWDVKILKKGKVSWTDDVFKVARENYAYDYVRLPNSNEIYSIDKFMTMFLMN